MLSILQTHFGPRCSKVASRHQEQCCSCRQCCSKANTSQLHCFASGKAKKRVLALGCIEPWIAAIRRRENCFCELADSKAGSRSETRNTEVGLLNGINDAMFFFPFPRVVRCLESADPEEAKDIGGQSAAYSDPLSENLCWREFRLVVKRIRRKRWLRIDRKSPRQSFRGECRHIRNYKFEIFWTRKL